MIAEITSTDNVKTIPTALQWGRDLVIAEMVMIEFHADRLLALQWGRDLVIAEMLIDGAAQTGADGELQWGRDLVIAEIMIHSPQNDS